MLAQGFSPWVHQKKRARTLKALATTASIFLANAFSVCTPSLLAFPQGAATLRPWAGIG